MYERPGTHLFLLIDEIDCAFVTRTCVYQAAHPFACRFEFFQGTYCEMEDTLLLKRAFPSGFA